MRKPFAPPSTHPVKIIKPPFHRALNQSDFFVDATIKVQAHESSNYWIYKTGDWVYKVKKPVHPDSAINLDELFCKEMQTRLELSAKALETSVYLLFEEKEQWRLEPLLASGNQRGYYVLKQRQLSERGFLASLLGKGKLKVEQARLLGHWLADFHAQLPPGTNKEVGSPEFLLRLLNDDLYQAKKHLGKPLTQGQLDLTVRPFEQHLKEVKKLLGQRFRKGFVKPLQGDLRPSKVHIAGKTVLALALSGDPLKNPEMDLTSDLADLTLALRKNNLSALVDVLVEGYIEAGGDTGCKTLLPLFETLKALKAGLKCSQEAQEEPHTEALNEAKAYYSLMVELARKL